MEKTAFTVLFMTTLYGVTALLVREHFFVETPMTWTAAGRHCKQYYTDLSSTLTEDDLDRVFDAGDKLNTTKGWIGLDRNSRDYPDNSTWRWSTGDTLDFQRWAIGKPDNNNKPWKNKIYYSYNCVYMHGRLWHNTRCTKDLPFFCFREYDRVLTLVQEKMVWEEALDHCRENYTDLASVVSENSALQFVNSSAGGQTEFVWMGLRFLAGQWLWVNRDVMQFSGWTGVDEYRCPAIPHRCGALSMKGIVWEPKPCEEKLNFICYTELRPRDKLQVQYRHINFYAGAQSLSRIRQPRIRQPDHIVHHAVMEKTAFTVLFMTDSLWSDRTSGQGALFVETPMTWTAAWWHCKQYYTDLSSTLTEDDLDRVFDAGDKLNTTKGWIGLDRNSRDYPDNSTWRWSTGNTLDFQRWAIGKPDNNNKPWKNKIYYSYNCVYMHGRLWHNTRCTKDLPFFCFREYDRVLTLVQEKMVWEEALDHCRENYTDLASVVSENSALQFVNSSAGGQTEFVWMGLRFLAGQWLWVNRDVMQFSGWTGVDEYRCPAIPHRCGALSMKGIVWEPKPCEEKLNFICYTELRPSGEATSAV
ncbi:hypothetical protein AAFF_G00233620 [Aldrovandia affinis]|uniref:C-type lectin domain-containing protein n=1 Tax=Aldrovandia affinis TaxID=143900 RepID=A0AAD7W3Y6_9TELE|nr:hypothetical protein AAFF_G00233620 [Aldrovandia affinis]